MTKKTHNPQWFGTLLSQGGGPPHGHREEPREAAGSQLRLPWGQARHSSGRRSEPQVVSSATRSRRWPPEPLDLLFAMKRPVEFRKGGARIQGNTCQSVEQCRKVLPCVDLKPPAWETLQQMRKRLAWRPLKDQAVAARPAWDCEEEILLG